MTPLAWKGGGCTITLMITLARVGGTVVLLVPFIVLGETGLQVEGSAGGGSTGARGEVIACTMDAYQCPDGSYVGRTGPKCEFVCPEANTGGGTRAEGIDYNSSRSNKTSSVSGPNDPGEKEADRAADKEIDKGVATKSAISGGDPDFDLLRGAFVVPPVLERSVAADLDVDGNLRGVSFEEAEVYSSEDLEEFDIQTTLHVSGEEVRSWDEKTKEAVLAHLAENDEKNDTNDFGLFVAAQVLKDSRITDIAVSEPTSVTPLHVGVSYAAKAKILGVFPMETTVSFTTADGENGITSVGLPWFLRLISTFDGDPEAEAAAKAVFKKSGYITLLK
jgi:hypothetical protein